MTPLISIIIPAYNAEKYLAETLDSLRAQSLYHWECIIVDDGSTDQTGSIAKPFTTDPRISLVHQPNAGVAAARNHGFSLASPDAPFVSFMDADDVYLPHALQALTHALEAQPSMIAAHGLAEMIDHHSRPLEPGNFSSFQRARTGFDGHDLVAWGTEKPTTFQTVVHHSRIYPPGLLLTRRHLAQSVGPFDGSLSPVEDWDMIIRLSRLGPIAFLDDVLLHYRRHPAQATTASLDRIYQATKRLHKKTFADPSNTPEHRAMLNGAHRAWQRMKIREKWAALSVRRPAAALKATAHIAAHACLLIRGRPF